MSAGRAAGRGSPAGSDADVVADDDAPGLPRRVDGSMSLLVDVMTHTLDEAYAERAARKRGEVDRPPSADPSRARFGGQVVGIAVLLLLGLLTGTAVAQVRDRAEASAGLRDDLTAEVADRAADGDQLSAQAAALRVEVAATRDRALGTDAAGRAAAERVQALELAAGTSAVQGPGIVLTVDDAPEQTDGTEPRLRGGSPALGRVNDRDLQAVVNGLWAAGAEAVAIDDVRLSSRAPIRSAGEAVLVDFEPLSPPYRILAVGRPADLEVGFVDGAAGRALQALAQLTGIRWELERSDELRLPAATEPQLRAATAGVPP